MRHPAEGVEGEFEGTSCVKGRPTLPPLLPLPLPVEPSATVLSLSQSLGGSLRMESMPGRTRR